MSRRSLGNGREHPQIIADHSSDLTVLRHLIETSAVKWKPPVGKIYIAPASIPSHWVSQLDVTSSSGPARDLPGCFGDINGIRAELEHWSMA